MRNLNSIIPNSFALQSVPKCVSNLLTIQAVFLALALAVAMAMAMALAMAFRLGDVDAGDEVS